VPLGIWPAFIDLGGPIYALASIGLGGVFMALAINVYHTREGREADRAAKQLFGFSILYLFLLFAVLLLEQSLARWAG
jgi:heme o synthase